MAVKPPKPSSSSAAAAAVPERPPGVGISRPRSVFLWLMSAVYMFAFGSLYHQIPGLYGDNGILPVRLFLKPVGKTFEQNFRFKPTLVWLAPALGLDVQLTVELLALTGLAVAFLALLFDRLRNLLTFALLWMLYFSLYQVGQTFMWFQWDSLLLEAGFLTILVAPLNLLGLNAGSNPYHNKISFWLVKWLLFRLMFASGVVKLTSACPTWWQLSALHYHFESQCLPTPLAWYAHQLPAWLLKLGVVGTYVVEIAVPFLFFSPVRALRIFSFYAQVLLQLMIILTGNYNFFNLLTLVLCVSLLDDQHLTRATPTAVSKKPKKSPAAESASASALSLAGRLLSRVLELGTYGALAYGTVTLFTIRVTPERTLSSKIAFGSQELSRALEAAVPASIYAAALSLAAVVLAAIYRSLRHVPGCGAKFVHLLYSLLWTGAAVYVFAISMVPHTSVDERNHSQVWPVVRKWHDSVERYQLVSPYGLFRRMTGVGGRPEVVIEGSNSLTAGWKEYHFLYKPGNLSAAPPIVAPHQPRLDWQMWFAALGTYQQNPWFLSLVHRLLNGQPEVLDLLDKSRNPFPAKPPKFIRAVSYTYQFTPWASRSKANWWTRKKASDYLPALSKDHQSLKDFLKTNKLIEIGERKVPVKNATLQRALQSCRHWISRLPAPLFLVALFTTSYTIKLLKSGLK